MEVGDIVDEAWKKVWTGYTLAKRRPEIPLKVLLTTSMGHIEEYIMWGDWSSVLGGTWI